jgi:hypothetical protein
MITKQTQLRISEPLKDAFKGLCRRNQTTMTSEIVRLMREFVDEHLKRKETMKSLANLETTHRTGLVQDSRGVWRTHEELLRQHNDDWRF